MNNSDKKEEEPDNKDKSETKKNDKEIGNEKVDGITTKPSELVQGTQEEPTGNEQHGYVPPPKNLDGFPDAKRVPNKGRARWKMPDGKILEWDYQHGEIEMHDKTGKSI